MYYNGMRINHLTVQKIQIRGFEMRRLHHKYCTLNRSTAVAVLVVVHRYIFIGLGLFFFFFNTKSYQKILRYTLLWTLIMMNIVIFVNVAITYIIISK